jgi:ATP-dependent DNA helicase RecG
MHRDYFDKSSDIMVEVYRNKMVVFNPGGLVKWLKPEEFGTISKTRNPIIASLLSRTIFVEKLGTGINRIKGAMKSSNLPDPEFKFYEHSFYVNLFDRTMIKGIAAKSVKTTPKLEQEFEKLGKRLGEKLGKRLGENQIKIIYFMKKDKFTTIIKLSDKLNISTTAIEKDIKKLKEKAIIKRVGSAKGGHWEVGV